MKRRRLPSPNRFVAAPGLLLIVTAVLGGGLSVLGADIPFISSWVRQVLLAILGLVVFAISFLVTEETAGTEAPEWSETARRRKLIAATPSETHVDRTTEVWVQICQPDSTGFLPQLPLYTQSGEEIGREDALSFEAVVHFPKREDRLGGARLRVTLSSPDFDIPEPNQAVTLSPQYDSGLVIFYLIPLRTSVLARLRVSVWQMQDEQREALVGSASLATRISPTDQPVSAGWITAEEVLASRGPRSPQETERLLPSLGQDLPRESKGGTTDGAPPLPISQQSADQGSQQHHGDDETLDEHERDSRPARSSPPLALLTRAFLVVAVLAVGGVYVLATNANSPDEPSVSGEARAPAEDTDTGDDSDLGAFPNQFEQNLLSHLPEDFIELCSRLEFDLPQTANAAITCTPVGADFISYVQYDNSAAMNRDYNKSVIDQGVIKNSGGAECQNGSPSEGTYTLGKKTAGRLMCYMHGSEAWMDWTHDSLSIYTFASRSDGNLSKLFDFWINAVQQADSR